MFARASTLLFLAAGALAHGDHSQNPLVGATESIWHNTLPGDGGTQADSVFSGITTFARLPYFPCLSSNAERYDIAVMGTCIPTRVNFDLFTAPAVLVDMS